MPPADLATDSAHTPPGAALPSFEILYQEHFDFVWRTVRRLGVPPDALDDAVQDVFIVAYRKMNEFEGRSSVSTWLFGIVRRTVRDHRPARRHREVGDSEHIDRARDESGPDPHESAERNEAARALHALLDSLDDDKREAFVLSELEQMPAPEIAEALGINVNTVYSRVRAARQEMDRGLQRLRAQQSWRDTCAT